tara:strand:+ start:7300 stop:7638 length:339 start_codon:yes stop_codon:yes gene_type:complete
LKINEDVLLSIPNLLLAKHIKVSLGATGYEVEHVEPKDVAKRIEEKKWDLVIVDLGVQEIDNFPPVSEFIKTIGLVTHRDLRHKPKWEKKGFVCVYKVDFFSDPGKFLFPES